MRRGTQDTHPKSLALAEYFLFYVACKLKKRDASARVDETRDHMTLTLLRGTPRLTCAERTLTITANNSIFLDLCYTSFYITSLNIYIYIYIPQLEKMTDNASVSPSSPLTLNLLDPHPTLRHPLRPRIHKYCPRFPSHPSFFQSSPHSPSIQSLRHPLPTLQTQTPTPPTQHHQRQCQDNLNLSHHKVPTHSQTKSQH
ncbi:hypothetical protein BJX63DRAFT_322446 [Aspergillus granulosus]|uniref:Uncharacterized protein n=1 Tax=Aspergillus granulosus TaxID=176169 RepID=A0ABR4H489_9EURO